MLTSCTMSAMTASSVARLLQVRLQRVELLLPEPSVPVDPLRGVLERRPAEPASVETSGALTDEPTKKLLKEHVAALGDWAKRFATSGA